MFRLKFKVIFISFLALQLIASQNFAVASTNMISTQELVSKIDRENLQKDLIALVSRDDVKQGLADKGLTAEEINSRIANLSDSEIQSLHNQVIQQRAGGDILVTILLVVLIIFLIKRI